MERRIETQDWIIGGALSVLAALVLLSFRPWALAALGDIAIFQLFGRLIADGQVPYRDFFDHKTPLAGYVNAVPAIGSNIIGTDLIIATRMVSIILAAAATCGLYLLARAASLSRVASLAAAGTYIAFDFASLLVAFGIEPKALVSYFGIFALLAAYRSRWAMSGVLCALSFLAWQPGGVFLIGAATWAIAKHRANVAAALARLASGFLVPLVLLISYFAIVGALDEFWRDAFDFNRDYVARQFSLVPPVDFMADKINIRYGSERWVFLLAALGAGAWLVLAASGLRRRRLPASVVHSAPIAAITLSVLVYSYVNFKGEVDIIPLLPWVAFWAAWLLERVSQQMRSAGPAVAAIGMAALLVYGHHGLWDRLPDLTSDDGRAFEQAIVDDVEQRAGLQDGDPIYAINEPWFLLASGRDNVEAQYYYLWGGVQRMIIEREGLDAALVRPIFDTKPKLIVLGPQVRDWLDPRDRTLLQQHYIALLLGYERIPPTGSRGVNVVTRAADYWVLRTGEHQLDFRERLRAIAGWPNIVGGWAADDLRPQAGSPTLVPRAQTSGFLEAKAWALGGAGATETVGGTLLNIPDDIDPNDGALAFDIIFSLSHDASDGEQVGLQLQLQTPSRGVVDSESLESVVGSLDVSGARSGQLFFISLSTGTQFSAGDDILLSIRRDSSHPDDTYPYDVHLLGFTAAYRQVEQPEP